MRLQRARNWSIAPVTCCSCGAEQEIVRMDLALTAGAGVMPNVPGVICERCAPVAQGPLAPMLMDNQTDGMLRSAAFELETPEAVQVFLNLWGWEPLVMAGAAMRLHLDGYDSDAHSLLEAAAKGNAKHARWFQVEQASLRTMDGSYGKALDLLNETGEKDHPCWNLHHGVLAQTLGRKEAALEHWLRQVEIEPEEPMGWKVLGWYYMQDSQDYSAAEALMRRAVERFPEWMEFRAWLGGALHRLGRPDEALAELRAAQSLDPIDDEFVDQVAEFIQQIEAEQA